MVRHFDDDVDLNKKKNSTKNENLKTRKFIPGERDRLCRRFSRRELLRERLLFNNKIKRKKKSNDE